MESHWSAKILIVEDKIPTLQFIENIVRGSRPEIIIELATTLDDALTKYKEFNPDFVLLDIRMAKRSGFELLKFIRKEPSKTKVIMVTNYNSEFYKNKSFKLGADYFVDKSKEFDKIPEIINNTPTNEFRST